MGLAYPELDPCPVCDSSPFDAPEGSFVQTVKDESTGERSLEIIARWDFPHCFRCGYRVDDKMPTDQSFQFAQFQKWLAEQTKDDMAHPTMQPPQSAEEAQAMIQQLQSQFGSGPGVSLPEQPQFPPQFPPR